MFTTKIKNETILNLQRLTGLTSCLPPNQSLKLTDIAVDDFAARCWTDLGASDWNVRATNYHAAAVRRRSLAPVR
jgi:hypothetical protein